MIKVICVGKIKEKFFTEAINEYEKRLSKYTNLQLIEVPDYNNDVKEICMKKEGLLIQKNINEKDFVITLDIMGNSLSSEEFAKKIDEILQINSNLVFVIGGSYGLTEDIKNRSNYKLSFSRMTFPHQLFRIIFLEQLYRTFKINNNESYHK